MHKIIPTLGTRFRLPVRTVHISKSRACFFRHAPQISTGRSFHNRQDKRVAYYPLCARKREWIVQFPEGRITRKAPFLPFSVPFPKILRAFSLVKGQLHTFNFVERFAPSHVFPKVWRGSTALQPFRVTREPPPFTKSGFDLTQLLLALGFFGLCYLIDREKRDDLILKIEETDPLNIQKLKKFVAEFNAAPRNSPERDRLLQQAFDEIDHFRYLAKLSPRVPLTPDIPFARKGLFILTSCDDSAVQYQAFKYLRVLLEGRIDPQESLRELLLLEKFLGQKVVGLSEVNDPVPLLEQAAACYGLVLETLLLSCIRRGSQIASQDWLEVAFRAEEMGKKLEKHAAFKYQASNAQVIATCLKAQIASQPVTEAFNAVYDIATAGSDIWEDIKPLLLESMATLRGLDKLKEFVDKKGPKKIGKLREAILRLELVRKKQGDNALYVSLLLLKPRWHSSISPVTDLGTVGSAVEGIYSQEAISSWYPLYQIADILSNILLSPSSEESLKGEAFQILTQMINPKTPWQVRYKIGETLLRLKRNMLFRERVEQSWKCHLSTPLSDLQAYHGLCWVQEVEDSHQEIESRIKKRIAPFRPTGKLKVLAKQEYELVPRDSTLDQLCAQFQQGPIQIIEGPRGVGKSRLAASYSERYGRDYTLIHWVDASTLEQDLNLLASHEKIGISDQLTLTDRLIALRGWLEDKKNEGWLIIVDDVTSTDELMKHLPRQGGHILFTTYLPSQIKAAFGFPKPVSIDVFSPSEAAYFLHPGGDASSREKARELARAFGFLPLALVQARAYIEHTPCSVEDFAALYQKHSIRVFGSSPVATLWDLNYSQAKREHPLVEELLGFLSHLSPDTISLTLIQSWAQEFHSDLDELDLDRLLTVLRKWRLIERDERICRIPPLLQQVARGRLIPGQDHHAQALRVLYSLSQGDMGDPSSWKTMSALIPHLEVILQEEPTEETLSIVLLLHEQAMHYFLFQAEFGKAHMHVEKSLNLQRKKYKTNDHPEMVTSLNGLAVVLRDQGDLERAKALHSQVLAIQRKVYGTDNHSEVATSLNNLAGVLKDQGDIEGAKALYSQALAIQRKVYGTDNHPKVAALLNNLAVVLKDQGDIEGAKTLHSQALAIQRKVYGTDNHPEMVASLNGLAEVLKDQGDLERAKTLHSQALAIQRKVYGTDNHPEVAASLNNLAEVLKDQGDIEGAKGMLDQALAIRRKMYRTDNHPKIAVLLNNLAEVLKEQGDLESAKALHSQALAIQREVYGTDNHPKVAASLNNLAEVLKDQGDIEGAKGMFDQALAVRRKMYGTDNHPEVAISLNNLAVVLKDQGDIEGAKKILDQALAIQRKVYGTDNHPEVATFLNNLAEVLKDQGDLERAKALHSQALAIRRKLYGTDNHPEIAISLNNLAIVLESQGDLEKAEELFLQVLEIRRRIYQNENHPKIIISQRNLEEVREKLAESRPLG